MIRKTVFADSSSDWIGEWDASMCWAMHSLGTQKKSCAWRLRISSGRTWSLDLRFSHYIF
jgi:hypothetical protein